MYQSVYRDFGTSDKQAEELVDLRHQILLVFNNNLLQLRHEYTHFRRIHEHLQREGKEGQESGLFSKCERVSCQFVMNKLPLLIKFKLRNDQVKIAVKINSSSSGNQVAHLSSVEK